MRDGLKDGARLEFFRRASLHQVVMQCQFQSSPPIGSRLKTRGIDIVTQAKKPLLVARFQVENQGILKAVVQSGAQPQVAAFVGHVIAGTSP